MRRNVKQILSTEKFKTAFLKIKDNLQNLYELCTNKYHACLCRIQILGQKMHQAGISANVVSISGFVIGLLAINFLALEMYYTALLCIVLNRLFDVLDGAIARIDGQTNFGIFLDISFDYIFYAGLIFGFALAYPSQNAVAATFWLFGVTSAAVALLAYAIIAYKNTEPDVLMKKISPFYFDGLAQSAEILIAVILVCLLPQLFVPIAIIVGCVSMVKALSVIVSAYYSFVISARKK